MTLENGLLKTEDGQVYALVNWALYQLKLTDELKGMAPGLYDQNLELVEEDGAEGPVLTVPMKENRAPGKGA